MRLTCVLVTAATVVLSAVVLVAAGACGASGGGASPSPSQAPVAREQVISLVDTTCAAIEKDAQGTFAAINAGKAPYIDSKDPSLYAFVFNRDVILVADPDASLQGKDMSGVADAAGNPFRDLMVQAAFADGSGWIEYVKEKPGSADLYRKESYYRLVTGSDGTRYVVGAGRYLGPWQGTASPTPS